MNANITRWAFLFVPEARKHNLVPSIVAGLIEAESGGNREAISHAGAVGLMQVMTGEAIAGRPSREELLDAETNVRWGCQILADNFARHGTTAGMLASYFGACDSNGIPNDASDGSGVDGWGYVRLVERAAVAYREIDQRADPDFAQYAPHSGGWREAIINVRGVADDALETGRGLKDDLEAIREKAQRAVDKWGKR